MKKIIILSTGGTIASVENDDGLAPELSVKELVSHLPEFPDDIEIDGTVILNLDSTNMQPEHWVTIAEAIRSHFDDYDGFVITHGTDTLGYTAAALSYMLQDLSKPVVLTGSQVPISFEENDAEQNLADAIRFAREDVGGVFVVFDGRVIQGTRAIKMRTKSYDAFESINYPYVAFIDKGDIFYNEKPQPSNEPLLYNTKLDTDVFLMKLYPGTKPELFDYVKSNYKGVIIESFGSGGLPFTGRNLLEKVVELTKAGVAVVITTQCLEEGADLDVYEVGRKAAQHPIIIAKDMNSEAIVAKLMWALGQTQDPASVKKIMDTPVAGDIYVE
jgi:L-asparaginase